MGVESGGGEPPKTINLVDGSLPNSSARDSGVLRVVDSDSSFSNARFNGIEDDDEELEMMNIYSTSVDRRMQSESRQFQQPVLAKDGKVQFGASTVSSAYTLDGSTPRPSTQFTGHEIRTVAHVALTQALLAEQPKKLTKAMFKLYFFLLVACLNSILNGYDSTVMGGLGTMKYFQRYFSVGTTGLSAGLIMSSFVIGNMVGSFFCGPLTDWWGRRMGMFTGGAINVIGTCLQGAAVNRGMFITGRFIIGFAVAISATAGPVYVAEMAHPAWRGPLTGFYNVFWIVGSIPAMWVTYKSDSIPSDLSWRLPIWLQAFIPSILCIACLFIPETPRWLYSNAKPEVAVRVLEKYHGEGNRKSPIVLLTYKELVEEVFINGSDKRWWDYSDLYNSKSAWWRNACVLGMAICSQLAGNVAISYFMPILLEQMIAEDRRWGRLYSAIFNLLSFFVSLLGACFTDRIGRRRVLMSATILFVVCWTFVTTLTGIYAKKGNSNHHGARAAVAFINIFQLTYCFAYTPLQALYPVECLAYETRAKGMGMYNLVVNLAVFFNTFAIPVTMDRLQWRFYIIYAGWNVLQVVFIYFFFVETKGRTLEQINEIFKDSNPPKRSLQMHTIVVDPASGCIQYTGLAPNTDIPENPIGGNTQGVSYNSRGRPLDDFFKN